LEERTALDNGPFLGGPVPLKPETLTLNCYRLAKFYAISPSEFLRMPISEVNRHMHWTNKLLIEIHKDDEE
jgi:hypothetical protein